ncbi:acetyltransferase [Vibrio breoganii]|uniref:NeuD/PglB/VioB family sugar acetyltransferase n=1 Tax=Vibrio breoganii TaxID=553239 RepID=UPI0010BDBDD7|nr:NeuD/PglB/VioB family sugar acetyltransferase [Vibrio breoganii]TKF86907.1 acetyltransferase [Vibrio breoganii]
MAINDISKGLVIVGASGLGKEIAFAAERIGITIKGFLDDNLDVGYFHGYPILGKIDSLQAEDNIQFIIAIAKPAIRHEVVSRLETDKVSFATIVDPSVIYAHTQLDIGAGSAILAGSVCTANISIGIHSIINKFCCIGHDVVIKDFTTLSPTVMLGGNVEVGNFVELGARTTVKQSVVISSNVITGMSTTVVKNLVEAAVYIDTPARVLKGI